MIVVYADGGGLGHLTRVRALRETLGLVGPITVLTSSGHVDDPRVLGDLEVVPLRIRRDDVAARRSWLQRTLVDLGPELLVVDAFPAGLAGEIDAASVGPSIPVVHVARLLQWTAYRRLLPRHPVHYERVHVIEPLHDEHHEYLAAHADVIGPLDLVDPRPTAIGVHSPWADLAVDGGEAPRRPRWLVAHTGPAAEVIELVAYARDQAEAEGVRPLFVVATASDATPPAAADLVVIDRYPVSPMFADADRIVTAAGFNIMRELAPHRLRHRFLPMPRRFDDQIERARRAHQEVAATAARAGP